MRIGSTFCCGTSTSQHLGCWFLCHLSSVVFGLILKKLWKASSTLCLMRFLQTLLRLRLHLNDCLCSSLSAQCDLLHCQLHPCSIFSLQLLVQFISSLTSSSSASGEPLVALSPKTPSDDLPILGMGRQLLRMAFLSSLVYILSSQCICVGLQ